MENNSMYDQVKKLLDYYKKKVAENGPSSLTQDDIKNLKNMNAVMELIRGTALEMIVTKAIEGDFTSIETYYLEKEQDIIDKYAAYEQREQELPGELVDAIARGDKDAEEKIKEEFALIAQQKEKFTGEMQQFKNSQLTPSDFVKKIIGEDNSKTLMTRVASRLAGTSDYIAKPSFNYNVKFFKIDNEEIVINEQLVDLATEYIQGKTTNYDLLSDIRTRQLKIDELQKITNGSSLIVSITRDISVYINAERLRDSRAEMLKKYRGIQTHFWTRNVKVDDEKVPKYKIKQAEVEYENANRSYFIALENLRKSYQELKFYCHNADIELPITLTYNVSEINIDELRRFINQDLVPAANAKIAKLKDEIKTIEADLEPKYKDVDIDHIDRIIYYGRGRIDNPKDHTFDSTLEALKLLKYVSKVKGLKPEKLIELSEIGDVNQQATNVIDDYLDEQRRTL